MTGNSRIKLTGLYKTSSISNNNVGLLLYLYFAKPNYEIIKNIIYNDNQAECFEELLLYFKSII